MKTRHWVGKWISGTGYTQDTLAAPDLGREFECGVLPNSAKVFLCGLGWHLLFVNGRRVDDRELLPTATQYDRHVSYVEYDILPLLRSGKNRLDVWLGNGYFNDPTKNAWNFASAPWRDGVKLLCDAVFDGQTVFSSDRSWYCCETPIVFNTLRNGEYYDARREADAHTVRNAVRLVDPPPGLVIGEEATPCRAMKQYTPVGIPFQRDRTTVYDFGVNLTGRARIRLLARPGLKVKLTYSERVRPISGDLDRANIEEHVVPDHPIQQDEYTAAGNPEGEAWESHFTFHGFRYVQVSFSDGKPEKFEIEAVFLHSAFTRSGSLETDHAVANALQTCTRQSFLANYPGFPVDCPHREKNGWTGDAALALETGLWNFDIADSSRHFLRAVADTQRPSGQLCAIAPTGGWGYSFYSGPAWDNLLFEVPYQLYLFRGETEAIREHYDAMRRYWDYCRTAYDEDGIVDFGLGDWASVEQDRITPRAVTSTGYYHSFAVRLAKFSEILGRDAEAHTYREQSRRIRAGFSRCFLGKPGSCADDSMTALATPVFFGMAEPEAVSALVEHLVQKVRDNRHRVDFGILGAKFVPRVLAEHGYADDAFELLTQTEFPGWGWWIMQGATTLWESWRGTSSQTHIMFGDISAWMFRYLGGLSPLWEESGFRHFRWKPCFVRPLNHAAVSYASPFGTVESEWSRKEDAIHCVCRIPAGCRADVELPGLSYQGVTGIQEFKL